MRLIPLDRRRTSKPNGPVARSEAGHAARSRHELVGWIALGLVVAVVLTVISRSSVVSGTPIHPDRASALTKSRVPIVSARREHESRRTSHPRPTVGPTTKIPPGTSTPARTTDRLGFDASPPGRTTETTTTTTTTTTTPTQTPRPQYAPSTISGTLEYPNDLASTFPFSSPTGIAAVQVSWNGGSELDARLHCQGATTSAPGAHGIALSVSGVPGQCSVTVSLAAGTRATVPFTLDVNAPDAPPK
jgi:hypothetical protein